MIFLKLFISFMQIGLFSFGGGYAAMPLIQEQVVNIHGWLSMSEFTDLITISQMTPGPIGINSATYVGYTSLVNAGYGHGWGVLGSVTASQSKGKGNSKGTINVNSKFEVGGTHKVDAGEKVIYEGANVEAGRVKIKGEEVIIASSKDTEKSSSKNSSSSIKVSQTPVVVQLIWATH